jgi:hypothetical protein
VALAVHHFALRLLGHTGASYCRLPAVRSSSLIEIAAGSLDELEIV